MRIKIISIILCLGLFSLLLLFINKGDVILYLNTFHSPALDVFISFATKLVEPPIIVLVLVLPIFYRISFWLCLVGTFLVNGIITQVLKQIVFKDHLRPIAEFANTDVQFVEGIDMLHRFSFPSGHTSSAFCVCVFFALHMKNNLMAIALMLVAILVAFSRMYLVLHYYEDVIFGAWIGSICAIAIYYFLHPKFDAQVKLQRGLFRKSKV